MFSTLGKELWKTKHKVLVPVEFAGKQQHVMSRDIVLRAMTKNEAG